MAIRKLALVTEISVKKMYVWFFPTDALINRRECNVARQ